MSTFVLWRTVKPHESKTFLVFEVSVMLQSVLQHSNTAQSSCVVLNDGS